MTTPTLDDLRTTRTLVSPINRNTTSKGNRDYQEQQCRHNSGELLMWDDAKGNPTKVPGGAFGFVHNGRRVEIHMVTKVCSTKDRLVSWSNNVGQTDRNVLYLTPRLLVIDWSMWISLGCPSKVQGTSRVVSAHDNLSAYLHDKLSSVNVARKSANALELAVLELEKQKVATTAAISHESETKTIREKASIVFEKANIDYLESCAGAEQASKEMVAHTMAQETLQKQVDQLLREEKIREIQDNMRLHYETSAKQVQDSALRQSELEAELTAATLSH